MNDIFITINNESYSAQETTDQKSALAVSPQRRHEVTIEPHDSATDILRRDSGIIPETCPNINITNDGPAKEITAQYFWSNTWAPWHLYTEVNVKMGETKLLSSPPNAIQHGMVKIINDTDRRVFVTAEEQ
ncbi:hypothetical protein ACGU0V_003106 [Serratia marcescens]|uniref:hypothetical protein n=1 Tax=Serratia marcescens TaxID=615 RepID=UPI0012B9872F|nr:hypothetical protein [Serratia marcescens]